VRVLDVVNSHADSPRWRLRLVEQARNHQRMGLFVANRRAILAVAGQIECTMPFALKLYGLSHHFFVTCDVVAGRDDRHLMAWGTQRISGMNTVA
jgi:hypothetical protein